MSNLGTDIVQTVPSCYGMSQEGLCFDLFSSNDADASLECKTALGFLNGRVMYLAEGVLPEGVEDAPDALLQVVADELEGVHAAVDVHRRLEVSPEADLADHIKALPLRAGMPYTL